MIIPNPELRFFEDTSNTWTPPYPMHFFWRLSDIRIAIKKSWCDWLRRDKARQAGWWAPKASSDGTKTPSNAMSSHFHQYHQMTSSLSWKGQNSWHLYWQRRNTETLSSNLFSTESARREKQHIFQRKILSQGMEMNAVRWRWTDFATDFPRFAQNLPQPRSYWQVQTQSRCLNASIGKIIFPLGVG